MNFYNYFSLFSLSMFTCFSSTCSMQESPSVATEVVNRLLTTTFPKPLDDKNRQVIMIDIIYLATNIEKTDSYDREFIKQLKNNPKFTVNLYEDISQAIPNFYQQNLSEKMKIGFAKSWEKVIGPIFPDTNLVITDLINRLLYTIFLEPLNHQKQQEIIHNIIYLATNIEKTNSYNQEQIKKLKNNPNFEVNLYQYLSRAISNFYQGHLRERMQIAFTNSWKKIIGPIIPQTIITSPLPSVAQQLPPQSQFPMPTTSLIEIPTVQQQGTSQQQPQTTTIPLQEQPKHYWAIPNVSEYSTEKPQPGPVMSVINTIVSAVKTIYYSFKALIYKISTLFGNES